MAAVAYVGSIGGALIGLHIPKAAFNPIILVLLVARRRLHALQARPRQGVDPAVPTAPGTRCSRCSPASSSAVYDGALGPGTGCFLVFALVGLLGYTFLEASAKAKIANFATNLGALTVFLPMGLVIVKVGARHGRRPTSSAATSAPGRRWRRGAGSCVWCSSSIVSAFIVRIGGSLLGWWP